MKNMKKTLGTVILFLPVLLMTTNVYARSCVRRTRIVYTNESFMTTQAQQGFDISKYLKDQLNQKTQHATEKTTKAAAVTVKTTAAKTTTTEKATETTTQAPKQSTAAPNTSAANEILNLVNKERAANGLSALKLDTALSNVAQAKAQDMYNKKYFSHTSPTYGSPFDMMKSFGISYRTAGENIAKGQKTPAAVMSAWMNSDGHRKNILGSGYTKLGVGYVNAGGTTYWVQMFVG